MKRMKINSESFELEINTYKNVRSHLYGLFFLLTFDFCFVESNKKKYCDKCAFLCSLVFHRRKIWFATPVGVYKFHNYSTHWFDRISSVVSYSSCKFTETQQLLYTHSLQMIIVTVEELHYKHLCGNSNEESNLIWCVGWFHGSHTADAKDFIVICCTTLNQRESHPKFSVSEVKKAR